MRDELFGAIGNARYRSYASDIANSTTHLISVISAILDLAKAEAGTITPEIGPVKLPEVFGLSVRLVEQLAADKSIAITVDLSRYLARHAIETDQGKLTQMLVNLLTNSAKFTEPGGTIRLTGERHRATARIIVQDTGVGIAAEDLDTVMTPFGQVASAYRSHDGFGLGLPMTKKLAEALGGTFTLESRLGEGTKATIDLPLRIVAEPAEKPAQTMNQAA
jgi:signal transduction histidine kinase